MNVEPPAAVIVAAAEAVVEADLGSGGGVSFRVGLGGTGVTTNDDAANYFGDGEGTFLLARDGTQAAGLAPGTRYQGLCFNCPTGRGRRSGSRTGTGPCRRPCSTGPRSPGC